MSEIVLMEVQDGVAVLTLNRPDRLNAWTHELHARYCSLLEECAGRDDVRAIVVTGAGRGFCAGADMDSLSVLSSADGGDSPRSADGTAPAGGAYSHPVTFPLTIPKPIIAAINGPCAGIGLVLALMCDLRFVASGAKLTTAFARRGLIAEHGISWILPRLIGPARSLDLLLSGRVILGEEATELGLVNQVLPDELVLEESLTYARMLASESSPASMAVIKRQVYGDYSRGLDETVEDANRLMVESFSRPDFAEGVQSFLERREPRFAGLSEALAGSASGAPRSPSTGGAPDPVSVPGRA